MWPPQSAVQKALLGRPGGVVLVQSQDKRVAPAEAQALTSHNRARRGTRERRLTPEILPRLVLAGEVSLRAIFSVDFDSLCGYSDAVNSYRCLGGLREMAIGRNHEQARGRLKLDATKSGSLSPISPSLSFSLLNAECSLCS